MLHLPTRGDPQASLGLRLGWRSELRPHPQSHQRRCDGSSLGGNWVLIVPPKASRRVPEPVGTWWADLRGSRTLCFPLLFGVSRSLLRPKQRSLHRDQTHPDPSATRRPHTRNPSPTPVPGTLKLFWLRLDGSFVKGSSLSPGVGPGDSVFSLTDLGLYVYIGPPQGDRIVTDV